MSNKYLIINADDFGVFNSTNKAIEKIFNEGTVTSTTLMTPCSFFKDAIDIAKNNKNMNVGLHITLNAEYREKWGSVSKKEEVPSLLDENGYFYSTVRELTNHAKLSEVLFEIESQYKRMVENGLTPDHADSHMGCVYGLTGVSYMKETLEFCAKYNLPFRFPKNLEGAVSITGQKELPFELVNLHKQVVDYSKYLKVPLIDSLLTNTLPFSEIKNYGVLKDAYINIIKNLPQGISEIFLHPSYDEPLASKDNPKWIVRQWELEFLLSDDLKDLIKKEDIQLISWKDVPFINC